MFGRIVGVVGIGLLAIFAIDFFVLRRRGGNRPSVLWQALPVFGFVGAILVTLAFAQAVRREVLEAWRWGVAFGLGLAFIAAIIWRVRVTARGNKKEAGWRAGIRVAQTYGLVGLLGALGVIIAVRVIGALLEVFVASALGVLVIAGVVGASALSWRRRSDHRAPTVDDR